MVDMAAVVGFAQSIRAALDITKAMKDVNDANMIQTKTFELTREIMAAQSYAMEAVAAQSALIDRIRELEASVASFEAWERQKDRYELKRYEPGVFLYDLKPSMANGEPAHCICPKCYEHKKRSILHGTSLFQGRETLMCHECSGQFIVGIHVSRATGGPNWIA
jgi:hypothetical protein